MRCYLSTIGKKTGMVEVVQSGGKPSYTKFKCLASNKEHNVSLIACYPETGRSHQLRVHLQSVGLPILGDKKYGRQSAGNSPDWMSKHFSLHHMLHAYRLDFQSPKGESLSVKAPLPKGFSEILTGCDFLLDELVERI